MPQTVHFKLPLPPTVNHYWKPRGRHGKYIGEEGVLFRSQVKIITAGVSFGDARLQMDITIHPKNKCRQDLDNRLKSLHDALQAAGVFDDDEQIDVLTVRRGEVIKGGLCLLTITPLLDIK